MAKLNNVKASVRTCYFQPSVDIYTNSFLGTALLFIYTQLLNYFEHNNVINHLSEYYTVFIITQKFVNLVWQGGKNSKSSASSR